MHLDIVSWLVSASDELEVINMPKKETVYRKTRLYILMTEEERDEVLRQKLTPEEYAWTHSEEPRTISDDEVISKIFELFLKAGFFEIVKE